MVAAAPHLRWIGHTSGASTLAALEGATRAGISPFSLHPLQTIPDGSADLVGAPAAVAAADEEGLALARALAVNLGMTPFEVPEDSRGAYHAAAAIASNFLVALESQRGRAARRRGDRGRARSCSSRSCSAAPRTGPRRARRR